MSKLKTIYAIHSCKDFWKKDHMETSSKDDDDHGWTLVTEGNRVCDGVHLGQKLCI